MGYYTNMLKDTAVLKTVEGTDENGRPNIVSLEEIDCKIEFKNSVSISSSGEEVTSAGKLYTETAVNTGDIIELKNEEYKVTAVNPYYPIDSSLFVINEVYFG